MAGYLLFLVLVSICASPSLGWLGSDLWHHVSTVLSTSDAGETGSGIGKPEKNLGSVVSVQWGIPDTEAFVGRLFQYSIPENAFSTDVSHYKVYEAGYQSLPRWLCYNATSHTFLGVPAPLDQGAVAVEVVAQVKGPQQRETEHASATHFVINVRIVSEHRQHGLNELQGGATPVRVQQTDDSYVTHPKNDRSCSWDENIIYATLVLDANLPALLPHDRVSVLYKMAHFLSTSVYSLKLFPSKSSSVARLLETSVVMAGPGNATPNSAKQGVELSWIIGCGQFKQGEGFYKVLEHNVGTGRLSKELGFLIAGWQIVEVKPPEPVQKLIRLRRQVQGLAPTPLPTPGLSSVRPTQITSMLTQTVVDASVISTTVGSVDSIETTDALQSVPTRTIPSMGSSIMPTSAASFQMSTSPSLSASVRSTFAELLPTSFFPSQFKSRMSIESSAESPVLLTTSVMSSLTADLQSSILPSPTMSAVTLGEASTLVLPSHVASPTLTAPLPSTPSSVIATLSSELSSVAASLPSEPSSITATLPDEPSSVYSVVPSTQETASPSFVTLNDSGHSPSSMSVPSVTMVSATLPVTLQMSSKSVLSEVSSSFQTKTSTLPNISATFSSFLPTLSSVIASAKSDNSSFLEYSSLVRTLVQTSIMSMSTMISIPPPTDTIMISIPPPTDTIMISIPPPTDTITISIPPPTGTIMISIPPPTDTIIHESSSMSIPVETVPINLSTLLSPIIHPSQTIDLVTSSQLESPAATVTIIQPSPLTSSSLSLFSSISSVSTSSLILTSSTPQLPVSSPVASLSSSVNMSATVRLTTSSATLLANSSTSVLSFVSSSSLSSSLSQTSTYRFPPPISLQSTSKPESTTYVSASITPLSTSIPTLLPSVIPSSVASSSHEVSSSSVAAATSFHLSTSAISSQPPSARSSTAIISKSTFSPLMVSSSSMFSSSASSFASTNDVSTPVLITTSSLESMFETLGITPSPTITQQLPKITSTMTTPGLTSMNSATGTSSMVTTSRATLIRSSVDSIFKSTEHASSAMTATLSIRSTVSMSSSVGMTTLVPSPTYTSPEPVSSSAIAITTAVPENHCPILVNHVDRIQTMLGRYFEFLVPAETFYDFEEGNTRKLDLRLLGLNHKELEPSFWIQFDPDRQVLYGLPMAEDVQEEAWEFVLEARDTQGLVARDALQIEIDTSSVDDLSHTFTVLFAVNYDTLTAATDNIIRLLQAIGTFYEDPLPVYMTVTDLINGSARLIWSNNTLSKVYCENETIVDLYNRISEQGRINLDFQRAMLPSFPVIGSEMNYLGICLPSFVDATTVAPTDSVIPYASYTDWVIIVVPAIIIVLLILIIALILLCLLRRKKNQGLPEEDKSIFKRNRHPVLLEDEMELKDQASLPKRPLVLDEDDIPSAFVNPTYHHPPTVPSDRSHPPPYQFPLDAVLLDDLDSRTPPPDYYEQPKDGYERPPPPYKLPPPY